MVEPYFEWHRRMREEYYRLTGHTPPYRLGTEVVGLASRAPPYWPGTGVAHFPAETRPYAIYALVARYPGGSGRELLYIGMTSRPDLRVQQHREHVGWGARLRRAVARAEGAGKRWHMEILDRGRGESWAKDTEARLIRALQPPGNSEGVTMPFR